MRTVVEASVEQLSQAFLEHPANQALREHVAWGLLSEMELAQQSFRVLFSLILLAWFDERQMLRPAMTAAGLQDYESGLVFGALAAWSAALAAEDTTAWPYLQARMQGFRYKPDWPYLGLFILDAEAAYPELTHATTHNAVWMRLLPALSPLAHCAYDELDELQLAFLGRAVHIKRPKMIV